MVRSRGYLDTTDPFTDFQNCLQLVAASISPYSIVSASPAYPGQAVAKLKNEIRHFSVTRLTVHIAFMAPSPLEGLLVPTANIFMIAK